MKVTQSIVRLSSADTDATSLHFPNRLLSSTTAPPSRLICGCISFRRISCIYGERKCLCTLLSIMTRRRVFLPRAKTWLNFEAKSSICVKEDILYCII
ncbi:hypothetical protein HRI_002782900 [Hibiscus trionum]|uniref:Uncharacterized protein n=1 Tax=Hibiscus trionum TaxID=183268 RepID=A0A9W7I9Q2_HIBTR|nr:hypothetical protein HRI_002782900 [Hibiscus trionum]